VVVGALEPRDGKDEAAAEVFGGGVEGETMDGGPEVELPSGGVTLEAAVAMGG
jgi:hypothetical protein